MTKINNWREDAGMSSKIEYAKKFAILPIVCQDGTKIWMKPYYRVYQRWGKFIAAFNDESYGIHTDRLGNITEAEYIVRKLTEGF